MFDYQKICQRLLKDLPERQKEVIVRRFALSFEDLKELKRRETLESIGKDFGVTRERVRQIEEQGLLRVKKKIKDYEEVFQYFGDFLKATGNLRREDILLSQLGKEKYRAHVFFLLTLDETFKRVHETEDFYSLWTTNLNSLTLAKTVTQSLTEHLKKTRQPLSFLDCQSLFPSLDSQTLESFLEISKIIQKNQEGLFGLKDWPEINPRGVRDKAYLVFKKFQKPLHFTEIVKLINELNLSLAKESKVRLATVHNELIRDPRFVLIGRGIYVLKEWGYLPGTIREIITKILKEAGRPLTREEIFEKVLEQRLVKKNSILLNLQNREYFQRDSQGRYHIVKEA